MRKKTILCAAVLFSIMFVEMLVMDNIMTKKYVAINPTETFEQVNI